MIRNSFRSVFLNTLLEKALRKQAVYVKDLLCNTCRRVGYFFFRTWARNIKKLTFGWIVVTLYGYFHLQGQQESDYAERAEPTLRKSLSTNHDLEAI